MLKWFQAICCLETKTNVCVKMSHVKLSISARCSSTESVEMVRYENTPMQYTAIFHGCKNVHFQMKIVNIFLIFAQNIDCGYTLEPPQ